MIATQKAEKTTKTRIIAIKDIINGDTVTFQDDRGTGQGAGQGEGADARYV